MAPRPHRCDHRRASTRQARPRCSCRCRRIPTSRRRRSRRRGFFLPARYGEAVAAGGRVGRVLRRRRRPPGAPRGDAVVLLRRRGRRRGDARPAGRPARAGGAARAGEPGHLVLHLPEDPAALPRRLPDHRLPRRRRPTHARRLPRSREREVHGVPRRLLRRVPPGVVRRARPRPRARSSTSTGSSATRSPRCTTPPPGSGSIPGASPPTRSAPRTAPPGSRARGSSGCALAGNDKLERVLRRHPDVKRKLRAFYYRLNGRPAEEHDPRLGARRSSRRATRNRTHGSLSSSTRAGIPLPAWLSLVHRAVRRRRRRVRRATSTPIRRSGSARRTRARTRRRAPSPRGSRRRSR